MDNNMMNAPYIFDACAACNNGNMPNGGCMAFPSAAGGSQYARAFVVPQTYTNIAPPDVALMQGTMFNDLYMPYIPAGRKRKMMMMEV